jgi:hypothetical protein
VQIQSDSQFITTHITMTVAEAKQLHEWIYHFLGECPEHLVKGRGLAGDLSNHIKVLVKP